MSQLLQRFLGSGDALARLKDHAARLMRLQTTLQGHLPPALAASCSVANLKDGTLVLLTDHGAAAARLKQLAPSLAAQLAASGLPVREVQVRVRLGGWKEAPRAPTQRTISETGTRSLEDFAASLPADSPLRESFERLVARSRRS